VRVSNRLVRRAVGCLHSSGSVRGRGVLTGGCLAAGLTTASMAPKPKTKFKPDPKAQPGEGRDRSNRVIVNLPVMLVDALQRMYKTEDDTSSSGGAGRAAKQSAMPPSRCGNLQKAVWHLADAAEKGRASSSAESGAMTGLQADGLSTRACILMVKIVVQRRHAHSAPSVTVAASRPRLAQRFLPRYLCLCQSNRRGEVKVGQWVALIPRADGPEEVRGANRVAGRRVEERVVPWARHAAQHAPSVPSPPHRGPTSPFAARPRHPNYPLTTCRAAPAASAQAPGFELAGGPAGAPQAPWLTQTPTARLSVGLRAPRKVRAAASTDLDPSGARPSR